MECYGQTCIWLEKIFSLCHKDICKYFPIMDSKTLQTSDVKHCGPQGICGMRVWQDCPNLIFTVLTHYDVTGAITSWSLMHSTQT